MTANRNLRANGRLLLWCRVAVSAMVLVQRTTAAPVFDIVPLGLTGPEHTAGDDSKRSTAQELNDAGKAIGYSLRYNGGTDKGQTSWFYNGASTIEIGFTGTEHTAADGTKRSAAQELNEAGTVIGYSIRFVGATEKGQTSWLYNGTSTIDIGLTGIEHTAADDTKRSAVQDLNEAGQVVGYSTRYNGGTDKGQTSWLYNGTSTVDIGFTGSEHTAGDGTKRSFADQLNEAGKVIGYSIRYNGGAEKGQSSWLYNGTTTIDIGLAGSEHTAGDGTKRSSTQKLSGAGNVIGYSVRYNGGTEKGQTSWLYNGTSTIDIGLTGSEHTASDGTKRSTAQDLNEARQVIGYSTRYGGNADKGQTSWLYNGATTIDLGFSGIEYTAADGTKRSTAVDLNEAGKVIGHSTRYNGGTDKGQTAWFYNGTSSIDIGLTAFEHTAADDTKRSTAIELNEAGNVMGHSTRYSGGTDKGQTAWLYNGTSTIDIGLTDSAHTAVDNTKRSTAQELNETGQVIGYSVRYSSGGTQYGQDAWLYDPLLDQTFSMNLSTRSDGYAYSSANYLGDDSLVLGTYTLYDASDNNLGNRAFYFNIADGVHDLGSLVEGGLAANDWDLLASTIRANGLGQIVGHGKLTSQSAGQMAYLMTPGMDGDFNGDGMVDAADYVVWREIDGSAAGYDSWKANFGNTAGAGSGAGAIRSAIADGAVPEPTAVLLAGVATLMIAFVVSRQRR